MSSLDPQAIFANFRSDLSKTLNLTNEEGEKWIVNLIRDSHIDAKIDLKQNMLHITRPHSTPSADIIDTTRSISFRSQAIQYAMQTPDRRKRT